MNAYDKMTEYTHRHEGVQLLVAFATFNSNFNGFKKVKKNTLKELLRMPFVDSGENTDYFALGWMQLIEARVLNYGSCVINSLPLV